MTYQNIAFRPAAAEELRLAALRQLTFEEPVSRLARLKKTVQRQLAKVDRDKLKTLSVYELAHLHGRIFFAKPVLQNHMLAGLLFSLALALDDFRVYSSTAFSALISPGDDFAAGGGSIGAAAGSSCNGSHSADTSTANLLMQMGETISSQLGLGSERRIWLQISLLATIDWLGSAVIDDAELVAALDTQTSALQGGGSIYSICGGDCKEILQAAQKIALLVKKKLRPSLVVLVEGQSELIVLPHFARLSGKPLEKIGALVIASGGAQQVVRRYLTLKDVLNIPIVCVFDGDAEDTSSILEEAMRDCDGLVCLEARELEDCYSYEQLLKILNRQLLLSGQTLSSMTFDIPRLGPRKQALRKLFRERGLGDFDKIAFAKSTVDLAQSSEDVPQEMIKVIDFVEATGARYHG